MIFSFSSRDIRGFGCLRQLKMANDFPSDKRNKKAYYVNARRNIFSHKNSARNFASNSSMSVKFYFVRLFVVLLI